MRASDFMWGCIRISISMNSVSVNKASRNQLGLADCEGVKSVGYSQGVTFGDVEIGLDHFADKIVEWSSRSPAKFTFRLGRIAQRSLDVGWTEVARVYRDDDIAVGIEGLLVDSASLPPEVEIEDIGTAL